MTRRIAIWLLLLVPLAPRLAATPPGPAGLSSGELDDLVRRTMETFQVPGIAVGVVVDGELRYGRGHGVRRLDAPDPVDADTLFAIASNTKAFTAAALALLVDEGRITWDDRVVDHLPQFRLGDPYVTQTFTIRDLLTHRSGLGPYAGDLMFFPTTDFTREEIISRLRYLPMTTQFRAEYAYDNNLYMVAGEVLAAVSGSSWEDFVETRILAALGLEPCAVTHDRIDESAALATPHAVVDGTLQSVAPYHLETGAAAGSIWCNIRGLATWVGVQLRGGRTESGQVLFSQARQSEMWSPQTILPVGRAEAEWHRTHFAAYGLGWRLSDFDGYKLVSHTGGLPGMVTMVSMLPELGVGVIVLTNQQSGAAFAAITYQILKAYTGAEPRDWVEALARRRAESRAKAADTVAAAQTLTAAERGSPSLDPAAYAGTYVDPWRGEVTIHQTEPGPLRLEFSRTDGLRGTLEHHRHDTFIVRWDDRTIDADAYVKFTLDFAGAIEGMTMRAVSPLTDPSYDFHDLDFVRRPEPVEADPSPP